MNYCPFCQLPLEQPVNQCPSCNADLSQSKQYAATAGTPGGTLKESADEIRAAIQNKKGGTVAESTEIVRSPLGTLKEKSPKPQSNPTIPTTHPVKPPGKGRPKAVPSTSRADEDSALPFRPVNRPPTLILCALDDGSRDEGEWYRVRKPQFRIGRTEGDIIIPNDDGISGRHLEITLRIEDGRYRYYLTDIGSRNGTFVRVSRAALKPDQQLLLGARRYCFNAGGGSQTAGGGESDPEISKSTRGWQALSQTDLSHLTPKLVEMTPRGQGHEFRLNDGENVLGTDGARCSLIITGDPFVSSTHAKIVKDKKGRWVIENLNSLNGIWLRITEMPLDTGGEFQIGEQRFLVRIP